MKIVTSINRIIKKALYWSPAARLFAKRAKYGIFDFEESSKDIPLKYFEGYTPSLDIFNDFYGNAHQLKRFAGLRENYRIPYHVEHGVFLDRSSYHDELHGPYKRILVASVHREEVLREEYNRSAYPIGPIIVYAKSFLSKGETDLIRKKSGKTLTAIPVHSTKTVDYSYDVDGYCKDLKKIAKANDFKTVRICLFYEDIQKNLHKKYEKYGFEIVSAGHMFDPLFLPRFRSIIEISDVTCSNAIGTHVVYSVSLGIPHYLKKQSLDYEDNGGEISQDVWEAYYGETELAKAFEKYSEKISNRQLKLLGYYAGLDKIKTKSQLRQLLLKKK